MLPLGDGVVEERLQKPEVVVDGVRRDPPGLPEGLIELGEVRPADVLEPDLAQDPAYNLEAPLEGLPLLGPLDVPLVGDELRNDLGQGDGGLRPRALQAVVLGPDSLPFLLEEELRSAGVLRVEREPNALSVRAQANVGVEEVVAGLLIPDGAFAAAGHGSMISGLF